LPLKIKQKKKPARETTTKKKAPTRAGSALLQNQKGIEKGRLPRKRNHRKSKKSVPWKENISRGRPAGTHPRKFEELHVTGHKREAE